MLQAMREHAQGWLAWVVLGAIAIVFTFWGVSGYVGSHSAQAQPVATVNGEDISRQELKQVYERAVRLQSLPQNTDEKTLREQALQSLITSKALTSAAWKNGYRVSDASLDEELRDVPAFQVNGKFSPERFQQVLSQFYYSPNEYRSVVRNDVLVNQLRLGVMTSDVALPNEIQTVMRLLNQKRDVQYALLPAAQFKAAAIPTESAIADFYEQNKTRFVTPDSVSIDYLQVSVAELVKNMPVTPAEVKQYYDDNIAQYTLPERRQVAHILIAASEQATQPEIDRAKNTVDTLVKRIKAGETLGSLAAQFSNDPESAKNKGVLPAFAKGDMVKPFADAAFGMTKVGEIVGPVRTSFGFHIIELQNIQKPEVQAFDKVADSIKATLQQQKAESIFAKNGEVLQSLTYENADSLAPAAEALHLPIKHSTLFTRKGGDDITANAKVIKAAFSDEVVGQKYNSDVIEIDPKTVVVLRLREHVPAKQQTLAEVKAVITQELTDQMASAKAISTGKTWVTDLQQGKNVHSLNWQTAAAVGREDNKLPAELVKLAFSLPKPIGATPSVGGINLPNGDYAIVSVKAVNEPVLSAEEAKAEQQKFAPLLANAWGQLSYQLYVDSVLAKAKIQKTKDIAKVEEGAED